MSISVLLCVQRTQNRSWSPGCQQRCRGVSAVWRWYWSVWLTLPSSPILSSPHSQITVPFLLSGTQLHWPPLTLRWTLVQSLISQSVYFSHIWSSKPLTISERSSLLTVVPQGMKEVGAGGQVNFLRWFWSCLNACRPVQRPSPK